MAQEQSLRTITTNSEATELLQQQRQAFQRDRYPSLQDRLATLKKLKDLLLNNQDRIIKAISDDYGNRSSHETRLVELFSSVEGINYTIKHLKSWMKPERRHVSKWFFGGNNMVVAQPKGVVGIIVPWNYPLFLNIGPLTGALAAGNRCMIKMAANSKNIRDLLTELFDATFPADLIKILPGVKGSEFSSLPFDHLIFTGSAETGKNIMRSASENLVPVTLELGGKSPVIIDKEYDLRKAAQRMIFIKMLNAGQTCVSPDYLFIHRDKRDEFVQIVGEVARSFYPNIHSDQYTSIIDKKAYDRLQDTLADAEEKGAGVIPLLAGELSDEQACKINPRIVLDVTTEMRICNEEIFGPLLPVISYGDYDEVLAYINERQNPLALYLFSDNGEIHDKFIYGTLSGGVAINDCALHVLQDAMPFGGTGHSGMGQYHGLEGFREFSKMRPIFRQAKFSAMKFLTPPYGKVFMSLYKIMTR